MNDCWERLGLANGAALKEVRRAYARILKETSVQNSPEEFQALRTAYETASFLSQAVKLESDSNLERVKVGIEKLATEPQLALQNFKASDGTIVEHEWSSAGCFDESEKLRSEFFRQLEQTFSNCSESDYARQIEVLGKHPALEVIALQQSLSIDCFGWVIAKHQAGQLVRLPLLRFLKDRLDWQYYELELWSKFAFDDVRYIYFRMELGKIIAQTGEEQLRMMRSLLLNITGTLVSLLGLISFFFWIG